MVDAVFQDLRDSSNLLAQPGLVACHSQCSGLFLSFLRVQDCGKHSLLVPPAVEVRWERFPEILHPEHHPHPLHQLPSRVLFVISVPGSTANFLFVVV
jgi:hypothetical protein